MKTKIEWCDYTYNPWRGCTKVSAGCANCYAENNYSVKMHGIEWGYGKPRRRAGNATLRAPLRWNKQQLRRPLMRCAKCGWLGRYEDVCPTPDCLQFGSEMNNELPRVFCGSLMDWLDSEVPDSWRHDLYETIADCSNLTWLMLTKRIERISECWPCEWWDKPKSNVWLGVSAEDQERWDERVLQLLRIPAAKRFVSVEPMLGPIDFGEHVCRDAKCAHTAVDWIILGGESGTKARPCNVDWIRSGVRQCREAGVPMFVKQLGANVNLFDAKDNRLNDPLEQRTSGFPDDHQVRFKHKKGGDPFEWPEDLRVREFPK